MEAHRLRMLLAILILLVCFGKVGLSAQETVDWRSWTSAVVNYRITKSLLVRTKLEYRLKDDISKSDRWSLNAGLNYNILPFLEIKGAYEFHHRKLGDDLWKFRHRYYLGAQASWKFCDFKLSWRERFQQTIQDGDVESMLRSRIKLDYGIPGTCLQPHFSIETFLCLNDGTFPKVCRIRYRPGVKIGFSKRYALIVFYCRQYEKLRKSNIAGMEMDFNF